MVVVVMMMLMIMEGGIMQPLEGKMEELGAGKFHEVVDSWSC